MSHSKRFMSWQIQAIMKKNFIFVDSQIMSWQIKVTIRNKFLLTVRKTYTQGSLDLYVWFDLCVYMSMFFLVVYCVVGLLSLESTEIFGDSIKMPIL